MEENDSNSDQDIIFIKEEHFAKYYGNFGKRKSKKSSPTSHSSDATHISETINLIDDDSSDATHISETINLIDDEHSGK